MEAILNNETNAGMIIEAVEKPYTLRKLCSKDVFIMSTILKNIGFKEFKDCLQTDELKGLISKDDNPNVEKLGLTIAMDIAGIIISNMANAEDSIYQLLSNLSGKTKEEIAQLDMEVFFEMLIDVFKQEGFANFFKVVSKLLK